MVKYYAPYSYELHYDLENLDFANAASRLRSLSNFAENYFIRSKEIDAVRQQHPHLDESPESEKIIMDALEKRYPGYKGRIKSITPDAVGKLRGHL